MVRGLLSVKELKWVIQKTGYVCLTPKEHKAKSLHDYSRKLSGLYKGRVQDTLCF